MDPVAAALLVLAGFGAAFLDGVFTVGSGVVLVPALLLYCHATGVSSLVATHVAMGTSVLLVAVTSAVQARAYARTGHCLRREAAWMGIAGAAGAVIAAAVASGLEGTTLDRIFGFVILVAAVRLFGGKRKAAAEREPDTAPWPIAGGGSLIGFVSSLSGGAAAPLAVPYLYTYRHFPLRKAVGTSAAAIVMMAGAGAAGFLFRGWGNEFLPPGFPGFIYWQAAIPLLAGAVPGVMLGMRAAPRADIPAVRSTFAVLLLVVMLRLLFF